MSLGYVWLFGALSLVVPASAMPVGRSESILLEGRLAGAQTVTSLQGGVFSAVFSFNDRGRGEHIEATWTLDAAGVPTAYSSRGNDYMKAPFVEAFRLSGGRATWSNRIQHGERTIIGKAFYVPTNAPPEFIAVLARALLSAPGRRLPLLPAGEARIESAGSISVTSREGQKAELTQYRITGLDFMPTPLWLSKDNDTAAILSSWVSAVPDEYQESIGVLNDAQSRIGRKWSARLAQQETHIPPGDVVIRDARLFDPRDLSVTPRMSVLVRGERIVRVTPDVELKTPDGAEVIDAEGRFLMPGLWDNHQHLFDIDGVLDLANGVTSARDMGNDTSEFLERVKRFDAGTELGPRVFRAGIIDGPGAFAWPTKMLVDTESDAVADVDWYANHGYGQIKIYGSVRPELVPVIADAAHARGLRVSGHVPAFMTAREFVQGGADEIQHLNSIVLNFLFDSVKDARGMAGLASVAAHARDIKPDRPDVQQFIAFLKARHTVLDPTMNYFEARFCGDPAAVSPGLEDVVARFPPQSRRGALSGALVAPKGEEEAYREAFPSMLRLLKALYDAGITIIPGTDRLAGYTLIHEMELYVRAGIPAAEVLRLATLTSARVVGLDSERGVIAPGKLADMILVDGDPTVKIADMRKVTTVVKGGKLYQPDALEHALGIAPRR
jgi:imidazolonepropionase-like amidohydrolase